MATQTYIPDITNIPYGPDYPYAIANTICDGIATFVTPAGVAFTVDADDAPYVAQFRWNVARVGRGKLYVLRNGPRPNGAKPTCSYLHRELLGLTERKLTIDHEDGDGLNNTRGNLRIATRSQNAANTPKHRDKTSSRFKGVYPKRQKWFADIYVRGRKNHLGTFVTEEQAARAYNAAAVRAFGSFAKLNVIEAA